MVLELDDHGAVLPQVLGAVYAASKLSYRARDSVFRLLRRATRWHGDNDERLMAYLTGDEAAYRPWRRSTTTRAGPARCWASRARRAEPERHPDDLPPLGAHRPPGPRRGERAAPASASPT